MAFDFENIDEKNIDNEIKGEIKKVKKLTIERKKKLSEFLIMREKSYQERRISDYCYYYAVIIGLERNELAEKLLTMPAKPKSEAELRNLLESFREFSWIHNYIKGSNVTVADIIGWGLASLNQLRNLQSFI